MKEFTLSREEKIPTVEFGNKTVSVSMTFAGEQYSASASAQFDSVFAVEVSRIAHIPTQPMLSQPSELPPFTEETQAPDSSFETFVQQLGRPAPAPTPTQQVSSLSPTCSHLKNGVRCTTEVGIQSNGKYAGKPYKLCFGCKTELQCPKMENGARCQATRKERYENKQVISGVYDEYCYPHSRKSYS